MATFGGGVKGLQAFFAARPDLRPSACQFLCNRKVAPGGGDVEGLIVIFLHPRAGLRPPACQMRHDRQVTKPHSQMKGLPAIPQGRAGFRSTVHQFLQNREMACFSSVVDGFSVVGASSERPKDIWAQHLDPVDLFNVPALPREPLNGLSEQTDVALNQGVQAALNLLYLQLVCHLSLIHI